MPHRRERARRAIAGGIAAVFVAASLVVMTPTAAIAADPLPNPAIPAQCGLSVTLVLDASGSVQQSNAVGAVRSAASAFLNAFADTGSTARVLQFASLSEELASRAVVTSASLVEGTFRNAIDGYYNPIPPRPGNVEIKRYNSGNPASASSWQSANTNNQYTNWDQSLAQAATDAGDLVVYVTDGDPTAYDFNQPGDPFSPGPPPDVGVGTDRNAQVAAITLDRAVQRANQVKQTGARVLAVGVGAALQNPASVQRLTQISGPNVANAVGEFDVETTDVALIADFDNLADAVRALVLDLCSPSLTIRKYAQSATDANYLPTDGWDMTVTPTVPGGFDWILPTDATGASATDATSGGGFAQFQWEPTSEDALSDALVEETMQEGFTPGRPGAPFDYRCEFKNADGDVRIVSGELTDEGATASFALTGIGNEIGTCSVYNSFDYEPAIAVTKVNSPTEARGDLVAGAPVTSTYEVTNPGNTPLSNVQATDDRCGPITPATDGSQAIPGDVDGDAVLDLNETWVLTCVRPVRVGASGLGATNVVNTVTVRGADPAGTIVTDQATDDVDLYVPEISIEKLVDGEDAITIAVGTEVTYTYEVTNTGDTPLQPVVLVDDTPPCEAPTLEADPGNGDDVLDVGETWMYSCAASPTGPVHNTATVTGTPLNPVTGDPFPAPNPDVTASDDALVGVTDPGLTLTKVVDRRLVPQDTVVNYTYVATNTGDTDLRNDTGSAGWVTDNRCAPVTQVVSGGANVGDVNGDDLLNPGEAWEFTCSSAISVRTVNIGTIVAQPVVDGEPVGDALTRRATAIVEVPGIGVEKTALVPVVLDSGADPVAGPDFPAPRPAQYLYEVYATTLVPISDVVLADDICTAVTFVGGDDDGDSNLDAGEVWQYTCEQALDRDQATPPPVNESGLVTNTATVTGIPFLPLDPAVTGEPVTDSDTAQVLVIEPGIAITKTASPTAIRAGGSVTYTFAVSNTGDVGLTVIGPTDDKCGSIQYVSGDNGNGILDGANSAGPPGPGRETWIYTCERIVDLPADGATSDVNVASVRGIDPLGNTYEATDTAEVVVLKPAIDLVKTASDNLVLTGSEVTYTFDVTNVGESPVATDDVLAEVVLRDIARPPMPSCTVPVLVSKTGGNQDDLLDRDPAETWTYECSSTIVSPTTNLAVVAAIGGTTFGLRLPVFAFDAEFVQTFSPAIEVIKTATPTRTVPGGAVTYTYEVRNTGDVPLSDVAERIADDTCSPVTYVSGDEDEDGLLDTPDSIFEDSLDEVWIFTCSTTVDRTTTNTVVVTGTPTDPNGEPLCDEAPEPGEEIVALAASTCDPTDEAQATVVVVPPLPPTGGSPLWPLLTLGALLLAIGGAALAASRRAGRVVS